MSHHDPTHTRCPACDAYIPAPSEVCLQCGAPVPAGAQPEHEDDSEGDFLDRLERLHQIHVAGGLSDAEFSRAKTRLLGESPASGATPAPQRSPGDTPTGSNGSDLDHGPSATPSCPHCQSHFVSRLRFFEKKSRKRGVGCMGCFVLVAVLVLTPAVLLLGAALSNDVVANLAVPLLVLLVVASGVGFFVERSKADLMICEACGHRFRVGGPPADSAANRTGE